MKTNISAVVATLAVAIITSGCGIIGGGKSRLATPLAQPQLTAPAPAQAPAVNALAVPAPTVVAEPTPTGIVRVTPPATATKTTTAKPAVVVLTKDGMTGGVSCLFRNVRDKTVTVTVATGDYKFTFDVGSKKSEKVPLVPGVYTYVYEVEGDPAQYVGEKSFTVTKTPTNGFKGEDPSCGGLTFSE